MRLWIVRHAHASPASTGADDSERTLSERGRTEAETVAEYLSRSASPDLILHSPFVRARQTAEAVARHFTSTPCRSDDRLTSDRHPRSIVEHLSTSGLNEVIVVSHEPLTGDLAGWLISGDLHGRISFAPATVGLIDTGDSIKKGKGVLRLLVPPETLSA